MKAVDNLSDRTCVPRRLPNILGMPHTHATIWWPKRHTHQLEMINVALRETDDSQKYPKYPIERLHSVCDTICGGTPRWSACRPPRTDCPGNVPQSMTCRRVMSCMGRRIAHRDWILKLTPSCPLIESEETPIKAQN